MSFWHHLTTIFHTSKNLKRTDTIGQTIITEKVQGKYHLLRKRRGNPQIVTRTIKSISPKGFQAIVTKQQTLTQEYHPDTNSNTPKLDMKVRLPANVTPDSVVISMCLDSLDDDSSIINPKSAYASTESIKLKCSEDSDSQTVFEGNVIFSSDMDISTLAKVPLIVFSNKTEIAAIDLTKESNNWKHVTESSASRNLTLKWPKK